jgi:ferric-dicitrate binding protein FerR (iron transport regulator)
LVVYRDLLRLRRELPRDVRVDYSEEERWLRVRRGEAELRVDFDRQTAEIRA